ncbi:hypothetical protein CS063_09195 [Sporanaerobium hydrogeniformans]|uniref:Uncharacterized protein n=2 Tax=Sporanaerobium hydrogeniformans TaxID=3072179 RepID=A0AC61DBT4_9FIRM|nr:hypothetical protein CS063_09195 [Sporanaerobium hydrogeniformans]
MKKINSINVGTKVLSIIAVFLIVLPICFFGMKQIGFIVLGDFLIKASLVVGSIITVISLILLIIELRQDRQLDKYFTNHCNTKLLLANSLCECQKYGNKLVRAEDTCCKICGIHFEKYYDSPPYI